MPNTSGKTRWMERLKALKAGILKALKAVPWMVLLDTAKKLVEIAAIIVAAWWAYTRFIQEDSHSLVQRADIQGNLRWSQHSKDDCEGFFDVEFQNIGKVPIEVARVRVSAWSLVADESEPPKGVKLLDPLSMLSKPPFLEKETDRMKGIYAPEVRRKHSLPFVVSRSLERKVLFKIDMWRPEDVHRTYPNWYYYIWSWPCGENPKTLLANEKKGGI